MNASAYIQEGTLCVVGTHQTEHGEIPFSCSTEIEGESTDGPIDVGSELPENIEKALAQVHDTVMNKVNIEKMKLAVRDVVLRARVGDQNAIATIVETKKAALRSPQAKRMVMLLTQFIKNNPVGKAVFGNEVVTQRQLATTLQNNITAPSVMHYAVAVTALVPSSKNNPVLVLANGPELDNERIDMIIRALPESERDSFRTSKLGQCVMNARRIQGIRNGTLPISNISKMAGFEFGEEV